MVSQQRPAHLPKQNDIARLDKPIAKLQADLAECDQRIDKLINRELDWITIAWFAYVYCYKGPR